MQMPSKLKPFLLQGCLLQLTAGSVAGKFGEPARRLAHAILEEDLATIIASDPAGKLRAISTSPGALAPWLPFS